MLAIGFFRESKLSRCSTKTFIYRPLACLLASTRIILIDFYPPDNHRALSVIILTFLLFI
jgi:ABC-type polysaccharide/polyol phosphate export permease